MWRKDRKKRNGIRGEGGIMGCHQSAWLSFLNMVPTGSSLALSHFY